MQINENKVKKMMSEDIIKTYQLQRENEDKKEKHEGKNSIVNELQEISSVPLETSASDDNNNIGGDNSKLNNTETHIEEVNDETAIDETLHPDEPTLSISHRVIPTIRTNQELNGDNEAVMLAQLLEKNREQAEKIKQLSQQLQQNVQHHIYQQQEEENEEEQRQQQLQEEEQRRQQLLEEKEEDEQRQLQLLQQQQEEQRQQQLQQQQEEQRQQQLQQQQEEQRQQQQLQQQQEQQQQQQLRHEDDIRRIVDPIHIGGDFYVPSLSYREAFNSYAPSKFVKIMSHALWGAEELATKVVRKQKNTGDKTELTPKKKVVLLYNYEKFLKKRNLSQDLYNIEVGKLNKYLGTAITSARKNPNRDRPREN